MTAPTASPTPCDKDPACAHCGAGSGGVGSGVAGSGVSPSDWAARRLVMARQLGELGLELAEAVQARALAVARAAAEAPAGAVEAEPSAAELAARRALGGDMGQGFNRLARSVRLSLVLEMRIEKDFAAGDEARRVRSQTARRAAEDQAEAVRRHQSTREDLIVGAVLTSIEAEDDDEDEDEVEALVGDLDDMTDDGVLDRLAHLPISGAIEHLCRDLGVTPDWDAVAREPWACEEAREGVPGSPFIERRQRRARERAARALAKDPNWTPASAIYALDVIGGLPPSGAGARDGPGSG